MPGTGEGAQTVSNGGCGLRCESGSRLPVWGARRGQPKKVKQMGEAVSRLHLVWVDGGFDGAPFMRWVMDVCHWTRGQLAPKSTRGFCCPSVVVNWAGSVGVGA